MKTKKHLLAYLLYGRCAISLPITQPQVENLSKNKLLYYILSYVIINTESGFNKYCEVVL